MLVPLQGSTSFLGLAVRAAMGFDSHAFRYLSYYVCAAEVKAFLAHSERFFPAALAAASMAFFSSAFTRMVMTKVFCSPFALVGLPILTMVVVYPTADFLSHKKYTFRITFSLDFADLM